MSQVRVLYRPFSTFPRSAPQPPVCATNQLQDLIGAVPGVDALPVDPCSGEPFHFDRDRRLIWSVGDDGIDQGAVGGDVARADPEQSRFDQLDWVWALPKPPELPATKP